MQAAVWFVQDGGGASMQVQKAGKWYCFQVVSPDTEMESMAISKISGEAKFENTENTERGTVNQRKLFFPNTVEHWLA